MENNRPEQQAPFVKKRMSDFRKALLLTAIPILICGLVTAGGMMAHSNWNGFGVFSGIAMGLVILAFIALVILAIVGKRQAAMGVLVGIGIGIGIGIVGLGITCFATFAANT